MLERERLPLDVFIEMCVSSIMRTACQPHHCHRVYGDGTTLDEARDEVGGVDV